jgi:hypothetical protein
MLKNITLSADPELIEKARKIAKSKNSTLNNEFRRWLLRYVKRDFSESDFQEMIARLNYAIPGKKFTRDEMNER